MNLADAFDAGVLPTWTEAIALTRAVAWQLYRGGAPRQCPLSATWRCFRQALSTSKVARFSRWRQIAGVGRLMGAAGGACERAAAGAGRAAAGDGRPPVYATLMEFHNALDFFARPDSKAVLADYHSRAMAAMEQTEQNHALEELKEKTKAAPKEKKKKKKQERKKIPVWVVAAAALVVLSLVGAAAFYLMGGPSPSSPVRQSANAALTAISEAGQKVQERRRTSSAS